MLLTLALAAIAAEPIGSAWVLLDQPGGLHALEGYPVGFAESVVDGAALVHGHADGFAALVDAGFTLRAQQPDHRRPLAALTADAYHDAAGVEATLTALAEDCGARCTLRVVGESALGQPLLALDIGPADAPLWTLVGGIHGDERVSVELALAVAAALIERAPPFDGLDDTVRVRVVPCLNPDGVDADDRYNANGVDLNRNFGYHWSPYAFGAGEAPFSEPESAALRALNEWDPALGSLMLHAGARNIGYVWNWTSEATPEATRLQELGQRYADATGDADFWVTQGADWYVTTGDATDWSFGRVGTFDFTVELSEDKSPAVEDLEATVWEHLGAVAALLAEPTPLTGQVLDAESGRPIPATLNLGGSAFLNEPVDGRFARTEAGTDRTLTATAPGYRPAEASANAGLTLRLERATVADLRPSPALLPFVPGVVRVELPGAGSLDPVVVLRRHGYADVIVETDGEALLVDPTLLVPGAWTIDLGDRVLPRALWVGNDRADTRVLALAIEGDTLVLDGEGFAQGAALRALVGVERAWVALPVLSVEATTLRADLTALPRDGTVDLALVSRGQQVPVLDLWGEPILDEGPDVPQATPDSADPSPKRRGCTTAPRPPSGLWALTLLLLGARRCSA